MASWQWFGRIHSAAYRATAGRLGGRLAGRDMLLLTTRGRRSGEPRTTPLSYFRDGHNFVVVASNNGGPRDPAWWLNLEQTPRATIQIGREVREVVASRATPEEWATLWPRVKEYNPFYGVYEQITTRDIPVVILRPVPA